MKITDNSTDKHKGNSYPVGALVNITDPKWPCANPFLIARINTTHVTAICLENGNRYSEPQEGDYFVFNQPTRRVNAEVIITDYQY